MVSVREVIDSSSIGGISCSAEGLRDITIRKYYKFKDTLHITDCWIY
jgi:hypothetical protein